MTLQEKDKANGLTSDNIQGKSAVAPLNGLVLTGGKSVRMGTAKDQLDYHGEQQRYYLANLLKEFCDEVFISCRPDQHESIDPAYGYGALPDCFIGMGPVSGILSAFRSEFKQPSKHAWLVVACDLPLLTRDALSYLVEHRNPFEMATAYKSAYDGLPEPLMTIWEPGSYSILLNRLGQDNTCPRKALIRQQVPLLDPLDKETLLNVNTPDQAAIVRTLIQNNG